MAISDVAAELQAVRTDIKSAIENKGVTVPDGAEFADYPSLILQIQGGTGPVVQDVFVNGVLVTVAGDPVFVLGT